MSRTLGLIGAGAVGPALARKLSESGWSVGGVSSRRIESAHAAVEFIGSGRAGTRNADAANGADLILIAVPDREIGAVAAELAGESAVGRGALALHFSGALSSELLAPLREGGASVGSLHPLQSFADAESAFQRLEGTFLFFEGDDPERIRAAALDLGGRPVPIERSKKVLYHAGAAAACNLAVAMIDLGVRLFEAAGIDRDRALEALLPLIEGTVGNLREVGLPGALTGPVARGDTETVRRHLDAIAATAPDLLAAFRAASRHAVEVGVVKGTLDPDSANALRELL